MLRYFTFICLLLVAMPLFAKGEWDGSADLLFEVNSGNTESESLGLKTKAQLELESWQHNIRAESNQKTESGETTADDSLLRYKADWLIDAANYLWAELGVESNRFSGFDQRISEGTGYGRYWIKNDLTVFKSEVGLGARQTEPVDSNETVEETTVSLYTEAKHKVNETTELNSFIDVRAGDDNTATEFDAGLKVKINSSFGLRVAVNVKNNSEVEDGLENTDQKTTVSLVYDF